MTVIDTVQLAIAAETGEARRRREYRHAHLVDDPLLVVTVMIPNEAAGVLAVAAKRARSDRHEIWVNPEPRNPIIRDDRIAPFVAWLGTKAQHAREDGTAPQVIVPGPATVDDLGVLARIYRYQRRDRTPLPEDVVRGALLLQWLIDRVPVPGSAALLAATKELSRIWVPPLSAIESAHLGALVAAIDPPLGVDREDAIRRAEAIEFGPVNDNEQLFPAVAAFNRARAGSVDRAVVDRLSGEVEHVAEKHAVARLDALEHAHALLSSAAEAPSAVTRWTGPAPSATGQVFDWGYAADVRDFARWSDRVAAGTARVRVRPPRSMQASKVAAWEAAGGVAEAAEVYEDPLAMAGLIVADHAWKGTTTDHQPLAGNQHPILIVENDALRCPFPPGTTLHWAGDPRRVSMRVSSVSPLCPRGSVVEFEVLNPRVWRDDIVAVRGCPAEVVVADLDPAPSPMPPPVRADAWDTDDDA